MNWVVNKELVNLYGQMELFMKVNLKVIISMELENIYGQMVKSIKDSGLTIRSIIIYS